MARAPIHVFIVDDDRDVIEVETVLLQAAGYDVKHDTVSTDAYARIPSEKPDCILIDIMMPGMDGLELCRELRRRQEVAAAKIIIVSAKSYEFDRKRALQMGADGFIAKPIDAATFVDQVERIIADRIKMTFWGVRGTLPVPGKRAIRYGGNTNCVTLEYATGEFFILDAGTGIKALSDHLVAEGRTRLDAKMFISHPHWDHINGLPFFVPAYVPGTDLEIFGPSHGDITVREMISDSMDSIYFPITIKEFGARVNFRDLREESFEIGEIKVGTMLLTHAGYCLGYRFDYKGRSICFITDNELYPPNSQFHNPHYVEKLVTFTAGANALVTDCTYTDEEYQTRIGWGHSCPTQVVEFAHRATAQTLYLYHHDPGQDDDAIETKLAAVRTQMKALGGQTSCVAPAEPEEFFI